MSKLDELIKELCPNGVEYKKLGELGTLYNGLTGKNKNDFIEGNQKYITYVNVFNNISIDIETQDKVKIDRNEKQNKVEYGDVIFTASSENIEDVGMTSVLTNLIEEDLYLNSFCFGFRFSTDIMLPSFSKYLFRSENLRKQIRKTANGVTRYNISKEKIKEILVPILPLKIQEEIVRILDDYTKSVEELKEKLNKELIARKKQYSWYRDYLLKFENKVEIVKLKDIATEMYRGNGIKREEVRETGIPCVRYGEIYTEYGIAFEKTKSYTDENLIINKKYIEYGDILFAITGESVEEIGKSTAYIGKEKCLVGGDILVMKHKQDPVYLSYVLSTENAQKQKSKGKIKSKVVHTNATDIGEIEIPLPPLEVQKRIVEVLDNFEKICNDLNIGLPAEIEARQKQYEFYRNFLLTFNNEEIYALSKQASKQAQNLIKILQYVYGYVEVRLGDIGKVSMCRRILKSETNSIGGIPFFKIGTFGKREDAYISIEKFYEYKEKYPYPKKGMILISTSGTIGRTVVFDGKPAYYQDSNIVWIDNDEERVLNKYLYYFYQTNPWKIDIGGTIERLYNENIEKTSILLPPLEEQQRIVHILDRFDKLCNDISEGLPAEIEARQKQYEYYREKLLSFKKL